MSGTNYAYYGPSGETDGCGNGLCHLHGFCASIDLSGDLWCPQCGWVGNVEVEKLSDVEFKIVTGRNKNEPK